MSSYDHTVRYTQGEKKAILKNMILDAWSEQHVQARQPKRNPHTPFDVRGFRTKNLDALVDALKNTEALDLLAEMVGVIDEGVPE